MLKKYKVKNFGFADIEPHEVFLDKLAQGREEELGLSEQKFEVPIRERMAYLLLGVFFVLAALLFSRIFYFQILDGKKLNTIAINNSKSSSLVIPSRGIIYDKNMKKLVLNSPAYDLICDRTQFKDFDSVANILNLNSDEIANKMLSADSSDVLIADNLTHQQILAIEVKIDEVGGPFGSCRVQENTARNYVLGHVFSQVLGYTGRINRDEYSSSNGYAINDYIGKTGLEKYYETYLRGKSGSRAFSDPIAGNNLVLNIDAELQTQLYSSLEKSLHKMGGKRGAAVAMDPRTGAVLALVSYPSYDDNLFSGGISQKNYDKLISDPYRPLFNRVVSAHYPTGSTIKPFEASAALQEKIISPDKLINDPGYILIQSQNDPDITYKYGGVTPHGLVDMRKAIAVSSNIYFYTVGGGYEDQKGLGPSKIKEYLSLFGWNQKTGIDLPGEYSGFIPDPVWKKQVKKQAWWDGDTYNLSIGQSDLQTTPLQVASAYCAIANGGTLYKPQIVNKIVSNDSDEIIKEFAPQVIRSEFIDSENLEVVREGMRDAVSQPYGLAKVLNDLPVQVAAKTGTAEIGLKDYFNVWSSAFAPYDNPEIVIVVTAEKVDGLGAVTLPVVHDVLDWYFSPK